MGKQERDIFKQGSTTYYLSSKLFPARVRNDVAKLYSFVRTADDYVDQKPAQPKKLDELGKAYRAAMADPNFESITHEWDEKEVRVVKNMVQLTRKYKFEQEWVEAFLKAMKTDVKPASHKTLESSLEYVFGSAEVIGLMMARIMKVDSQKNIKHVLHIAKLKQQHIDVQLHKKVYRKGKDRLRFEIKKDPHHAPDSVETEQAMIRKAAQLQGRAMQWINFVRDIAEDNELGRQYIPSADLKKVGLNNLKEETARENPEAFKKLIDLQLKRYREWQDEASKAYRFIPKRLRVALQTATDLYDWTAKQIEKDPFIVFEKKVKPSKAQVAIKAPKAVFKSTK